MSTSRSSTMRFASVAVILLGIGSATAQAPCNSGNDVWEATDAEGANDCCTHNECSTGSIHEGTITPTWVCDTSWPGARAPMGKCVYCLATQNV